MLFLIFSYRIYVSGGLSDNIVVEISEQYLLVWFLIEASELSLTQVDDKLYIYLEYVSGGSIHKLLREYGQFGELVIRSYTQQILSGLAYLHAKNTLHR